MLENKFTIISAAFNAATRMLDIEANFAVNSDSVDKTTVQLYRVINDNQTNEEIRRIRTSYELIVKDKIISVNITNPLPDSQYYIYVTDLEDKLGRRLYQGFEEYFDLTAPAIGTSSIVSPISESVIKTKNVDLIIAISGEKNINTSDIAIFNEDKCVIEISNNSSFIDPSRLVINHDGTYFSDNKAKYAINDCNKTDASQMTLSITIEKDGQYFVRTRLEDEDKEEMLWSDPIIFIVKTRSLLDKSDDYMNKLLYTDSLFQEEFEPLEAVNKSEIGTTDNEFFIEFNKAIDLDEIDEEDMQVTSDGLICIGKCYIFRRDK